jgi:hypothetical protein
LFALNSLDQIRTLHRDAIADKAKLLAAQQAASETAAKSEIEHARAASEQRIREFQAEEAAKYGAQQQAHELAVITNQEAAEKARISLEYAAKARDKVLAFLKTDEGKKLDNQIQDQIKAIQKKQNEERADIDVKDALVRALMQGLTSPDVLFAPDYEKQDYNRQLTRAIFEANAARGAYKESKDLSDLRSELRRRLDIFNQKVGVSYDDAKALLGHAAP